MLAIFPIESIEKVYPTPTYQCHLRMNGEKRPPNPNADGGATLDLGKRIDLGLPRSSRSISLVRGEMGKGILLDEGKVVQEYPDER